METHFKMCLLNSQPATLFSVRNPPFQNSCPRTPWSLVSDIAPNDIRFLNGIKILYSKHPAPSSHIPFHGKSILIPLGDRIRGDSLAVNCGSSNFNLKYAESELGIQGDHPTQP